MTKKSDDLSDIWKLKQRGQRDSDRQKELIDKAIRKKGKDLITEYNIIKSDGDKKIKIPIRFLDRYRFKYGKLNEDGGVGQGLDGKPGDKFKTKSGKKGDGSGPAGEDEGEQIFNAEISIDELVTILLDELQLPWMEPKNNTQIEIDNEEMNSIEKIGIRPNLDIKRSLIQNLKRNAAQGNPKIGGFEKDDLRYKVWENETEKHSNAAIYLMLDRSASMDMEKTNIAKTFYFWMVQFLKRRYKQIDLVFIAHDSVAFIVDEDEFFKISPSGGTKCSTAFKLAHEHIKQHHPADQWNNYIYEFSDGDNYPEDNDKCVELVNKLLPLCRAIGYGEIVVRENPWVSTEDLLSSNFNRNIKRTRFVANQFKTKDDIFEGLKKFFNVDGVSSKDQR